MGQPRKYGALVLVASLALLFVLTRRYWKIFFGKAQQQPAARK